MGQELLYQRIVDKISRDIDAGILKPGDQAPSVAMIKRDFQVSHITALRALKELTAAQLIEKQPGRGYFVTVPVRTVAQYQTVGCLLRKISVLKNDHYFNEIMHGIQQEAVQSKFNLLFPYFNISFFSNKEQLEPELLGVAEYMSPLVKGFIVDERIGDSTLEKLVALTGKPIVVVNRRTTLPFNSVAPDHHGGMKKLFETLCRLKYNDFIYADSGMDTPDQSERKAYLPKLLEELQIQQEHCTLLEGCFIRPWEKILEDLFAHKELLQGHPVIVCSCDSLARSLCRELLRRNFRVPDQIGITGFGGLEFATCEKPALTTLKVDTVAIGTTAMRLLADEINGTVQQRMQNYLLPLNLVFGETI